MLNIDYEILKEKSSPNGLENQLDSILGFAIMIVRMGNRPSSTARCERRAFLFLKQIIKIAISRK